MAASTGTATVIRPARGLIPETRESIETETEIPRGRVRGTATEWIIEMPTAIMRGVDIEIGGTDKMSWNEFTYLFYFLSQYISLELFMTTMCREIVHIAKRRFQKPHLCVLFVAERFLLLKQYSQNRTTKRTTNDA